MNYTKDQERAILSRARRICVDAGAGSGKTRVLVDRIVHLLESGAQLDEIVAITFTDKAAAEMKERLRRAIRQRTPGDRDGMNRWRALERQAEHARITTIHTFCGSLLREHALALGLDPDFAVLAEGENQVLLAEVVRDSLHTLLDEDDPHAMLLLEEYRLNRLEGVIRAMLQQRILVEQALTGMSWREPAVLLESWKLQIADARKANETRVRESPDCVRYLEALRQFDGCCGETDAREELRVALIAFFECVTSKTPTEHWDVYSAFETLSALKLSNTRAKRWGGEETFAAIRALQLEIKTWLEQRLPVYKENAELDSRASALTSALLHVYASVNEAYARAKQRARAMDFDDLIVGGHEALRDHAGIRTAVARSMKHLLIDEFQDTDSLQLSIANALADEPEGPNLFIVGDAKQSIYYFRGAEVEVFDRARANSIDQISLGKNFRSRSCLLNFVNETFVESDLLRAVEKPYRPIETHHPARDTPSVEFLVPPAPEHKENAEEMRRLEAKMIAQRLLQIVNGNEVLIGSGDDARPAGFGDITLLFRAMSSVYIYEDALRRAGIPYSLVAGAGFFERQEIIDILNLLRLVLDPWDEMALLGFLRSPMAGLSDEDITRLGLDEHLCRAFHVEHVPANFDAPQVLARARGLIHSLRAHRHEPLGALLRRVLRETQYEAVLLSQYLGLQKSSNLRKLLMTADEFELSRTGSLREFLDYLSEMRNRAIREGEALLQPDDQGAVRIMTIHKSKGLEFNIVVIPDMGNSKSGGGKDDVLLHRELGLVMKSVDDEGALHTAPAGQIIAARLRADQQAEYARLLYVALTRARELLLLSGHPKPGAGSWLETFDTLHGLSSRNDGDLIEGKGWRGIVRRDVERLDRREQASRAPLSNLAELEAALSRPLQKPGASNTSISRLLDTLEHDSRQVEAQEAGGLRGTSAALLRGSLVHAMLQYWRDFSTLPDFDALIAEFRTPLAQRRRLRHDLEAIARRVQESPLARLLADPQVRREVPFILRFGEHTLRGTIDALLADGEVIDYKTGRFSEESHVRYSQQVLLYSLALQLATGKAPEAGYLYYVDEDRLERVEAGAGALADLRLRLEEALSSSPAQAV